MRAFAGQFDAVGDVDEVVENGVGGAVRDLPGVARRGTFEQAGQWIFRATESDSASEEGAGLYLGIVSPHGTGIGHDPRQADHGCLL